MKPDHDLATFLAHAVVLESEAAERYDELAAVMAEHNNPEIADLFEKMAYYSRQHRAEAIERARAVGGLPDLKPWEFSWPDAESPEAASFDQVHYLMGARQALILALAAEKRARDFYAGVSRDAETAEIAALAAEFAEEEAEHAEALERWIERYPAETETADDDPDPPMAL